MTGSAPAPAPAPDTDIGADEVASGARQAVLEAAAATGTWPTTEALRPAIAYVPPRRAVARRFAGRRPPPPVGPTLSDALAAVDRLDAELRVFTVVDRQPAGNGPLASVKDVIHVAGMPTLAGSDGYRCDPVADAAAVDRLRRAGYRILGKTETHELALGVTTPQSRNPHDPKRLAGGSSGGAAISVVTGMAAVALGTDTRASIRVPAALCGAVGFKPTYGTVPVDGVVTLSWTMDHVAPMAATVGDVAQVLEVLGAGPVGDAWDAPVRGARVGVAEAAFEGCEPVVAAACHRALAALADQGVVLVPAPALGAAELTLANQAGLVVSRVEAAAFHAGRGTSLAMLDPETAGQLAGALQVSGVAYLQAQRARAALAGRLMAEADRLGIDAWALPTSPVVAPPVAEAARYLTVLSRNAIPWSLTGFPAVSVPVPSAGLPVGLQLAAPPGEDATLVALGAAVEHAAG